MANLVGPALSTAGGRVGLVVSALRDDNPGPVLEVFDCGNFLMVLAPHHLRATVRSLRWHLGAGFGLGELESMVVSSLGRVRRTGDTITWQAAAVRDAPAP